MTSSSILQGVILGFSIAAPVGPIGIMCIQRTLDYGMRRGFVTGLGAACADGVYGAVAGFGMSAASSWLVAHASILGVLAGAYLLYLGLKALWTRGEGSKREVSSSGGLTGFGSSFLLTLTNPMTILSFIAIFAALGDTLSLGRSDALGFVLAVVTGSAIWWLILSTAVALLRHRVSPRFHRGISIVSGVVLGVFGVYSILRSTIA
jgi:threonine/homoserine/homoserine lactone efflux protein